MNIFHDNKHVDTSYSNCNKFTDHNIIKKVIYQAKVPRNTTKNGNRHVLGRTVFQITSEISF